MKVINAIAIQVQHIWIIWTYCLRGENLLSFPVPGGLKNKLGCSSLRRISTQADTMPNYFFPTELSPVKSNNREIWAMLQTLIWSTYEQVFAHSDINVLASLRLPRPAFYTKHLI